VTRGFDDDFVSADAVHTVEHAVGLAVERAFDAESGELVGDDTDGPTRGVLSGWGTAVGGGGRLGFRAGFYSRCRGRRGRNPPFMVTPSRVKSVGALGASVEIMTQRPSMGSFLTRGTRHSYLQDRVGT